MDIKKRPIAELQPPRQLRPIQIVEQTDRKILEQDAFMREARGRAEEGRQAGQEKWEIR
jgi:hypothetical protein